jgi:hypothetical protein
MSNSMMLPVLFTAHVISGACFLAASHVAAIREAMPPRLPPHG